MSGSYFLPEGLRLKANDPGCWQVAGHWRAAKLWRLGRAKPPGLLDAARGDRVPEALSAARAPFAGLPMDRPQVMGILNITPDSFSDGGDRFAAERAIADGLAMWGAGAVILDVGGESTRPGAAPVSLTEEQDRVLPVIEGLVAEGCRVSIDSRNAATMAAALDAGAAIVNDVTALRHDPDAVPLVARRQVPLILMHMQGQPQTMQADPRYEDVALDVFDHLAERIAVCEAAGLPRQMIAVDPGIGFGKTLAHNLVLLDRLALFHGLGCPILLGASRKSFIAKLMPSEPKERLPGSLAAVLAGAARGVQLFRVHDVPETLQALAVWQAVEASQAS